jgi:hypothetical protein
MSTVLSTARGSWEKHREGDPKGWFTVLVTVLVSWGKPVPCGQQKRNSGSFVAKLFEEEKRAVPDAPFLLWPC